MNIGVCVKQVPDTATERKLRSDDSTLDREAADGVINELDEYAVEEALTTKESQGGEVPQLDAVMVGGAGLTYGDLLARAGHAEAAGQAWRAAADRIRPIAERLNPAAMTLLGQLDLRLGGAQDARAWADRVVRTTYRHPAFADLQQRLGPTPLAGEASRP